MVCFLLMCWIFSIWNHKIKPYLYQELIYIISLYFINEQYINNKLIEYTLLFIIYYNLIYIMNSNVWDLNLSSWRLGPGQLLTSPGNIRRKVKQVSSVLVIILTLWCWNNCANLSVSPSHSLPLPFFPVYLCLSVRLALSFPPAVSSSLSLHRLPQHSGIFFSHES